MQTKRVHKIVSCPWWAQTSLSLILSVTCTVSDQERECRLLSLSELSLTCAGFASSSSLEAEELSDAGFSMHQLSPCDLPRHKTKQAPTVSLGGYSVPVGEAWGGGTEAHCCRAGVVLTLGPHCCTSTESWSSGVDNKLSLSSTQPFGVVVVTSVLSGESQHQDQISAENQRICFLVNPVNHLDQNRTKLMKWQKVMTVFHLKRDLS